MGEIIFKTELIKGAKGDRGEAGQADSIPTDSVIAFRGETVPDGYEETDPDDVFDEVYEDINAVKDMIAEEYDNTATYNAGDFCTHENGLYKCTAATTGLWDGTKWVLTSASDQTKANSLAIEAIVEVNGACNALPIDLAVSDTIDGVTFTVTADGIVVSGTATADIDYPLHSNSPVLNKNVNYKLTGCPAGGSSDTYYLQVGLWSGSTFIDGYRDHGNGNTFNSENNTGISGNIIIKSGTVITMPITFKPMLYDARLNPTGYVPYAMTNRELTDRVMKETITVVNNGSETWSQMLGRLYALIDWSKVTPQTTIETFDSSTYRSIFMAQHYKNAQGSHANFTSALFDGIGGQLVISIMRISFTSNYKFERISGTTYIDYSDTIESSGGLLLTY